MPKLPLRIAKNTIHDVAAGAAMFLIMLAIVGFMSLGALSTDTLPFDAGASPGGLQASAAVKQLSQAPSAQKPLSQNAGMQNAEVLAIEPYQRAYLAPTLSFSQTQGAILMLSMMFALIGVFVRRSVRHLRRVAGQSRHQHWAHHKDSRHSRH